VFGTIPEGRLPCEASFLPAVTQAALHGLVSTKHERLERKHQSLQPKNERMHEAEGIHSMKSDALQDTVSLDAITSWLLE
jgi:hypothetical protein